MTGVLCMSGWTLKDKGTLVRVPVPSVTRLIVLSGSWPFDIPTIFVIYTIREMLRESRVQRDSIYIWLFMTLPQLRTEAFRRDPGWESRIYTAFLFFLPT